MSLPVPTLSIVTGTINRPAALERLIHSLVYNTSLAWELIVMDASDVPYAGRFSDLPNTRIIHESPRLGHVKGYNMAFDLCLGEYVIWLNDDAEVLPGYDTQGIWFLQQYLDVGLGAYYYKQGPHFHVNVLYNMIFANFGIISRQLGDQIGWFDEDLTMYGSDNSLTFRVLLAGYGVATVPGPYIIHHAEQDPIRIENEKLRKPDGDKMHVKYGPLKRQMQDTYNKTAHLVGPRTLATPQHCLPPL